jgi:hypothetical protein
MRSFVIHAAAPGKVSDNSWNKILRLSYRQKEVREDILALTKKGYSKSDAADEVEKTYFKPQGVSVPKKLLYNYVGYQNKIGKI